MEFKGSKGKWLIDQDKWIVTDDKSEYGDIICVPPEGWDLSMINWEANALLISNAPEMLEALKECYRLLKTYQEYAPIEFIAELKQLIKDATEL